MKVFLKVVGAIAFLLILFAGMLYAMSDDGRENISAAFDVRFWFPVNCTEIYYGKYYCPVSIEPGTYNVMFRGGSDYGVGHFGIYIDTIEDGEIKRESIVSDSIMPGNRGIRFTVENGQVVVIEPRERHGILLKKVS